MEKLNNIAGCSNIMEYVRQKLVGYEKQEKNFETLFDMMFSERENVMAEITNGYRIQKVTYGEFRQWILECAPSVKAALGNPKQDSIVGIYMNNSMEWLVVFWCVLLCGCRPLLLNTRMEHTTIEQILQDHGVYAVISDEKNFSINTYIANEILKRGTPVEQSGAFGSEVIFMSSGTTDKVKLCAYSGENFYYQVCCSLDIVEQCPDIARHYEGELKQLTLLPFYHVFGFIAVYLWFGFFSRTFVFLKDMNPSTILNTVRKHKVTHIFAVPLVWDSVYREAMRKIKARGEDTFNKFKRGLHLCNSTGKLGDWLAKRLLSEVRDAMFGPSVLFMISGGSNISADVVGFFNGIGYPLANGYGMTEVGITSVEMSMQKKIRNKVAVGNPFKYVEYTISEDGGLLIRSKAMASRIVTGDTEQVTNYEEWFQSNDMAVLRDGRYYLQGRADDLIICQNGENINPVLVEDKLKVEGCVDVCLFAGPQNEPVLIASAPDCYSSDALHGLYERLRDALQQVNLAAEVKNIVVTPMPLMDGNEFKVNRRKVARNFEKGVYTVFTPEKMDAYQQEALSEVACKVRACFAEVLNKAEEEIGVTDDFFADLGGSSLDFFRLRDLVKTNFNIDIAEGERALTTVGACVQKIVKEQK